MLDNDNIISTSASEAVEKIPTHKKITANAPFCVLLSTAAAVKRAEKHIANSRNSCLPTRIHSVWQKE